MPHPRSLVHGARVAAAVTSFALLALLVTPERAEAQLTDRIGKAAGTMQSILDRAKKAKAQADSARAAAEGAGAPAAGAAQGAAQGAAPSAAPGNAAPASSAGLRRGSEKIEELVVAPNEQDLSYSIHPKGSHLAAVVRKGSRFAVSWDGVVGPAFDRINMASNGVRIAMSPDGKRFGYVALSGSDYVVMVDGKEVRRAPFAANPNMAGGAGVGLAFTPNSRHFHFLFRSSGGRTLREAPQVFFWDGVAGPISVEGEPVISPDGDRHAYVITNPDNGVRRALVVDGKVAPYVASNPVFTADGAHLYTTRDVSQAVGRPATELLLDGRPLLRATNVAVHVPPAGDRVVVVVGAAGRSPDQFYSLMVGGQRVAASEASGYPRVVFSPDGRRYAAVAGMNGRPQRMIIDGKAGQPYDAIDSVYFSPDSKHVAYTARSGANAFVIVDQAESDVGFNPAQPLAVRFTPHGRVGWIGGTNQGAALVVDGKVTRFDRRTSADQFSFSPDGARFAHVVGGFPAGGNVAIDNVVGPPSTIADFAQLRSGDPVKYLWSPNGKYTVHYGAPGAQGYQGEFGLMIGGRYISQGRTSRIAFPTFTPDSKHLFWMVEDGNNAAMKVFLDGRAVYSFDDRGRGPLNAPGGWAMTEGGTLVFFIQTVDGFKRVAITPDASDGFEAMVARGKPLR